MKIFPKLLIKLPYHLRSQKNKNKNKKFII